MVSIFCIRGLSKSYSQLLAELELEPKENKIYMDLLHKIEL